jgi:hypothetical protein
VRISATHFHESNSKVEAHDLQEEGHRFDTVSWGIKNQQESVPASVTIHEGTGRNSSNIAANRL